MRRDQMFPFQEEGAARLVAGRHTGMACLLQPGAGKTITTLTALVDLGSPRTLILAPARVAETVWHEEAARWDHTRAFRVTPCVGTPSERLAILRTGASVVLSYENLGWLLETCPVETWFKAIVFDELSKMKHPGTSRFMRLRKRVPKIPIRIGLTGTPVGNHLQDVWGEMFMVAGAAPLGPTHGGFMAELFSPNQIVKGRVVSWRPRPGAEAEIHRRIRPYAFTMDTSSAPPMAGLMHNPISVALPDEVEEMSRKLVDDLTVQLESGTDLEAFSASTAAMKVRQMTGGAVYVDAAGRWEPVHGMKLQALEELVAELQGEPLLVGYWFKHEAERLMAHFQGKARKLEGAADINAWNRREVEVLLVHPASAGHGINLQHGGHNICWYTLPWSLEMLKQTRGRLIRHGQKSPFVMEHVLLAGATDRRVWKLLGEKGRVEDALLAAMLG
jgi:hypothetical protein